MSRTSIRACVPALYLRLLSPAFLTLFALSSFGADTASAAPDVAHRIFQWRPFLAPFHAVVLHFPIGFIAIAFFLELYRIRRPSDELRRVTNLVLWLALLSGAVTATFGMMRADTGDYEKRAVELHRAFGLWVPILVCGTLLMQKAAYRDETFRAWTYGYRLFLVLTLVAVGIAGHLGGTLTHGSRYLVENAPEFVRDFMDDKPTPMTVAFSSSENERFFVEKVRPIFSAKCYQCHGSEKQKNGYRLDDATIALKGGKSGKIAIKPGDPGDSNLVRLILLAPDNDDAMPPSGKEPLSNDEIMNIVNWVRKGAQMPGSPSIPPPAPPNG